MITAKRRGSRRKSEPPAVAQEVVRGRIMGAAFRLLVERGYAGTNTLEIARRAKVSKRELYALFGSKRGIILHMVAMGAARMQLPLRLLDWHGREEFAETLTRYGTTGMRELTAPHVTAIYRLAIAEAENSPDVAGALETAGRGTTRAALIELMQRALTEGVAGGGTAEELAAHFAGLLWGDVLLRVLLKVIKPPTEAEAEVRARAATKAFLQLHPPSAGKAG
jgi:AcrR family transcriptional regulator